MKSKKLAPLFLLLATTAFSGEPLVLNDEKPWLVKPTLDTRIRYEYGELEGLQPGHNGSIRNRAGLLTRNFGGFQGFAEYEGTIPVDRNSYRAASVHGPATKTIIADPESHELNQLWLSYGDPGKSFLLKAGRQALVIDNQRYVGGVKWRQNMQTFDAASLKLTPTEDFELLYGYVSQVNRIFGSDVFAPIHTDFEGNTHLINAKIKSLPFGTLTGYTYLMDLTNEAGSVNSNNSFGLWLSGDLGDSGSTYYLEYGHQVDAYDSPLDYSANYGHGYVTFPLGTEFKTSVGMEYLGSDNGVGYKFPLATLHKFNGFADNFLATPAGGLTDVYFSVGTTLPCEIGATLVFHHFEDDGFDVSFGNEVDIVLTKALRKNLLLLGKGAFFEGDSGFRELTRATIELNWSF